MMLHSGSRGVCGVPTTKSLNRLLTAEPERGYVGMDVCVLTL